MLALGLFALIPFCALALLAFTRAPTEGVPVTSPYSQSGTLSYSADAAPGPVYPDGRAVTGEPLFTRLIREVEYRYAYNFKASAAHSLRGKAQLYATVAAPTGWRTTLALASPTYFRGGHTVIAGVLDLASLTRNAAPRGQHDEREKQQIHGHDRTTRERQAAASTDSSSTLCSRRAPSSP